MDIKIPQYVEFILNRLEEEGYESYLVGGCIRDILMDKVPQDFDITTNALPEQIQSVFNNIKTIDVGKKFGTIIVLSEGHRVEVTTFRVEGSYSDGRRPDWVNFCTDIKKDLSRRDFTINALAYNKTEGIVDPFHGMEDLNNEIIQTVGDPEERFKEDYLRILRAIRFSCELKFKIERKTYLSGKKNADKIRDISMERIQKEFFKMLLSETPSTGIRLMEEMGVLKIIIPEIIPAIGFDQKNPHHDKDVYNHILCVLDNTPSVLSIRLAALFHDIGKPYTFTVDEKGIGHFYNHDKKGAEITEEILERFKCSKELTEEVRELVELHMKHGRNFGDKGLKRLIRRMGKEKIFSLFTLQKADKKCSSGDYEFEHIIQMENRTKEIIKNKEAFQLKDLDINGRDLINLGYREGKIIGEILNYLLEEVMGNSKLNEKKNLMELVNRRYPLK